MTKEAHARIKLNQLLTEAGWRFFDDAQGKANIVLENNVKLTSSQVDACGENFETLKNGFVFLGKIGDYNLRIPVIIEKWPICSGFTGRFALVFARCHSQGCNKNIK